MSGIFNDSKWFVDSPVKGNLEETFFTLQQLLFADPRGPIDIKAMYEKYFDQPGTTCWDFNGLLIKGSELEPAQLSADDAAIEMPISSLPPNLNQFALSLHSTWAILTRRTKKNAYCNGCSSLISVENPFIAPGGRFHEFYYWDSFWILKGLLASDLLDISKGFYFVSTFPTVADVVGMLENFYQLLEQHGFIPNGNRVYYLNRSQPPLLTQMVRIFYDKVGDKSVLEQAIPYLIKEYQFWMKNRIVELEIEGNTVLANIFKVEVTAPRPESFFEDLVLASSLDPDKVSKFYSNVAAGAETGWDFSSRWLEGNSFNLTSIETESIVPVDLNSIMFMNEKTIAWFLQLVSTCTNSDDWESCVAYHPYADCCNNVATPENDFYSLGLPIETLQLKNYFCQAAVKRQQTIHKLFWHNDKKMWYDYDISEESPKHTTKDFTFKEADYLSNLFPLWTGSYLLKNNEFSSGVTVEDIEKVIAHMNSTLLSPFPGGAPTSLIKSNQQWDFPNAWPPLQWVSVEALLNMPAPVNEKYHPTGLKIASDLVQRWVQTNFCGWNGSNAEITEKNYLIHARSLYKRSSLSNNASIPHKGMFEKYDARYIGTPGGGGEYEVQDGFGWTNGVILDWLNRFNLQNKNAPFILEDPRVCPETLFEPTSEVVHQTSSNSSLLLTGVLFLISAATIIIFSILKKRGKLDDLVSHLHLNHHWLGGRRRQENYENLDETFIFDQEDQGEQAFNGTVYYQLDTL